MIPKSDAFDRFESDRPPPGDVDETQAVKCNGERVSSVLPKLGDVRADLLDQALVAATIHRDSLRELIAHPDVAMCSSVVVNGLQEAHESAASVVTALEGIAHG